MDQILIYAEPNARAEELASLWCNLADHRIGCEVVSVSDDFFAPAPRMLNHKPPVFIPDKYDDHGKWMDGWESRRKRIKGHDHCTIKLGLPGHIKAFDIDTSHFTGNYPPEAWVEACWSQDAPDDDTEWIALTPKTTLRGNQHNIIDVDHELVSNKLVSNALVPSEVVFNYVRLHISPDGGVARFRVFGKGHKDWHLTPADTPVDLAAMNNGGRVIAWNDAHFGQPVNIIAPGRGLNMADGWETRRRREPGNDWLIIRLGTRGVITKAELDTAHFKGNYPDGFSLRGALMEAASKEQVVSASENWPELLSRQKLEADAVFVTEDKVIDIGLVTHVRLDIFPDGGVSRLRLFGLPMIDGNDHDD